MGTVFMEEMTWAEIQEAMARGVDTVIVCAASHEQHGPHMAESTDYVIGRNQYGEVARRLGALVAPVIRPGLSPHHMSLPGSLTLRPEVFRGIVEDYVDCYARHGFRKIVLGSSHGGNFAVLDQIAEELDAKYPDVRIVSALSLADFTQACSDADECFGLEKGACGGHACCLETSIMLYLAPELVKMDLAARGYMSTDTAEGAKKLLEGGVKALSPTGILGDATCASAEMGKAFFDMLVERTCRAIEEKWK